VSTRTRDSLEEIIWKLLCDAARDIRMAEWVKAERPWRRHDERRFLERAEEALLAVKHLEAVMPIRI
jgi:hypothetical protein